MKPLSSAMQIVLARLRAGEIARWMPYMGRMGGAYWFMNNDLQMVTKQIEALHARGLVTYSSDDPAVRHRTAFVASPKDTPRVD